MTVLFTILMLTHSLWVMIATWFLFGAISPWSWNVGYIWLTELTPKNWQTPVTSIWFIEDAAIYVVAILYFWLISKHWIYYTLVGYVWQILATLLVCLLPESPRFLVSVGKLDEAKKSFETIAKWNRKELVWDESLF